MGLITLPISCAKTTRNISTAPVSVFKYADPEAGGSGQMMAAATMVTIPVFFIVLAIQKQLAAGLTVGGISK